MRSARGAPGLCGVDGCWLARRKARGSYREHEERSSALQNGRGMGGEITKSRPSNTTVAATVRVVKGVSMATRTSCPVSLSLTLFSLLLVYRTVQEHKNEGLRALGRW